MQLGYPLFTTKLSKKSREVRRPFHLTHNTALLVLEGTLHAEVLLGRRP